MKNFVKWLRTFLWCKAVSLEKKIILQLNKFILDLFFVIKIDSMI